MLALIIVMSILAYFGIGLIVGTTAKIRSKEKTLQKRYRQLEDYYYPNEKARLEKAFREVESSISGETDATTASVLGTMLWPFFLIGFAVTDSSRILEEKLTPKVLPKNSLTNRLSQIEEMEKIRLKNDELVKLARKAGIDTTYLRNDDY